MLFKDAVSLPPHSSFRILSHQIAPDSTSNGSNSTGRQGTSNPTLKRFLFTLSTENDDSNAIAVGKAVNARMKVIYGISGDANKVKIAPWKSKQPNLEVLKYINGGKYPKAEVGKYVYAVREVQSREVRQYARIQLSVAHEVTWEDWYTTLRGIWMKKG